MDEEEGEGTADDGARRLVVVVVQEDWIGGEVAALPLVMGVLSVCDLFACVQAPGAPA